MGHNSRSGCGDWMDLGSDHFESMTTASELLCFYGVCSVLGLICGMGIASAFYRNKIDRLKHRILMLQSFPSIERSSTFFPVRPFFMPRNRRLF
jgi:hypothetical protein